MSNKSHEIFSAGNESQRQDSSFVHNDRYAQSIGFPKLPCLMLANEGLLIFILTTHPHADGAYERLVEFAANDRFRIHRLTTDPNKADMIIFVQSIGIEMFQNAMRRHPLVKKFPEKCFCFCEADHQVSFLPGIYTSVQKRWASPARERGGFYLAMYDNPFVSYQPASSKPKYLFSFIGDSTTDPSRNKILKLSHPRAFLEDTAQYCWTVRHEGSAEERRNFEEQYANILRESSFVLCPRGWSPSSVRLFETLKVGRVPVIISDQWVAPEGPDWDRCSVRIAEADIANIPRRLEELEPKAEEMGKIGRTVYEEWFAEDVRFHRVVEWCRSIDQSRSSFARRFASRPPLIQIFKIGRTGLFLVDIIRSIRNAFLGKSRPLAER